MKILYPFTIILISTCSCTKYSTSVEETLRLSGENRHELEAVIEHYSQNSSDSLKLEATYFLIENMPGHFSYDSSALGLYRPI
jgi:hypothetical protein